MRDQHIIANEHGGYSQARTWVDSIGDYSDKILVALLSNPLFLDGLVNRGEYQLRTAKDSLEPNQRERVILSEDFSEILERGS